MIKKLFEAILAISLASLWILNFFSGIVGGIWLLLTGGGSIVLLGIIYSIVMPWGYTIASLPTFIILPLITKTIEKRMKLATSFLAFILSGYNNFILLVWVLFVFGQIVSNPSYNFIALLLWGYSVAMGPVGYMASKEGPDAGSGTTLGVLFTQIIYIAFCINIFLTVSGSNLIIPVWLILIAFTGFTAWLGFVLTPNNDKTELDTNDDKFENGIIQTKVYYNIGEFEVKKGMDLSEVKSIIQEFDCISLSYFMSALSIGYNDSKKLTEMLLDKGIVKKRNGTETLYDVVKE